MFGEERKKDESLLNIRAEEFVDNKYLLNNSYSVCAVEENDLRKLQDFEMMCGRYFDSF
jgi:hypothetical protein